jgi:DNA-binding transcriptional MerR regulator
VGVVIISDGQERTYLCGEEGPHAGCLPRDCSRLVMQKEAYNLKEIEKFSVKLGLPLPTVKEILDSLVSDDLVICEKIGAGNFYWSFPSQAYQSLANKIKTFTEENSNLDKQIEELEERVEECTVGKEETDERTQLNLIIAKLEKDIQEKEKELAVFQRNDPKRLDEISRLEVNQDCRPRL